MHVEAAAEAAAALRDAPALAQRLGSRILAGPLTYMPSAWAAWERTFGDLRRAEELAHEALDLATIARVPTTEASIRGTLAGILLDRGDVEAVDAVLAQLPTRER